MTDRDEAFERLRASDPAASNQPDLSALRAKVMDAVDAEGVVVPLASRRRFSAPMAVAAVLALTVATGSGVLAGRATAPTDLASLPTIPVIGQNDGRASGPEIGVASDAMGKGGAAMMWPGWRTILEPTSAIPNDAGTAKAYRFSNDGVDPMVVATRLSELMEATGSVRIENGSISAGGMDGQSPSIWVADDAMVSFSAYSPERSPWYCVKNETPPSGGGTDSGSSAPDRGCEPEQSKAPSEGSAVSAVRDAFTRLGLDLDTVRFTARTDGPNVNVQAMLVVDGRVLQSGWYADVAAKGIHNINGFAARLVALPDYEIVGARDAALRSQDPRWSIIGPNHIWDGDNGRVGIMNADDTVSSDDKTSPPPAVRTVGGRPVLSVMVNTVTVTKATLGLTQHWLSDNQMVLLPSWEFEGTDGSRWSMLAVADAYVDFVSSR
jgi:hypothetical protein